MPSPCNCATTCTCIVLGDGATSYVQGTGSADNPYVVTATGEGVHGSPLNPVLSVLEARPNLQNVWWKTVGTPQFFDPSRDVQMLPVGDVIVSDVLQRQTVSTLVLFSAGGLSVANATSAQQADSPIVVPTFAGTLPVQSVTQAQTAPTLDLSGVARPIPASTSHAHTVTSVTLNLGPSAPDLTVVVLTETVPGAPGLTVEHDEGTVTPPPPSVPGTPALTVEWEEGPTVITVPGIPALTVTHE